MADYQSLRIERPLADVAQLTLVGPGRGNAMGPHFWRELPLALAALEADAGVRALIVCGAGEHYSFGLDLPAMAAEIGPLLANGAPGRRGVVREAARMQAGFDALAASRLPVIAAAVLVPPVLTAAKCPGRQTIGIGQKGVLVYDHQVLGIE